MDCRTRIGRHSGQRRVQLRRKGLALTTTQYPGSNQSLNLVNESAGRLRWRGRRPEDGGVLPGSEPAEAHDLPEIVDGAGLAGRAPGEGPEVCHRAVLPEERFECRGRVAEADDLTQIVDADGHAAYVARKGPEVRHRAVLPHERVVGARGREAVADDLPQIVDGEGLADRATQGPEIHHRAVLPEERMELARGGPREAAADDLPQIVDAEGHGFKNATQGPDGRHRAVRPEERDERARGRLGLARALPEV